MRWTLTWSLAAIGVLLAPLSLFAHITLGPNWIYFAVALTFAALISWNTTSRRFLHGFLVGVLFFAVFGGSAALLWAAQLVWSRLTGGVMSNHLSDGLRWIALLLGWLSIAGVVSGLLVGSLAWAWSKALPRERTGTVH